MKYFKKSWWKILCVLLLTYSIIAGFFIPIPELQILHESIRNLFFHVPMWFGMTVLLGISVYHSISYLMLNNLQSDIKSSSAANVALLYGVLGLLTGMQWARVTWGAWWVNDPKLMGAAVGLLLYLGYFVLRGSIDDLDKRAKVAAVTNIMLFAIYIPAIFIVPRLTDSLHPGNGGNPGFNAYDLDSNLRMVFYPAVLGWILLGVWISSVVARIRIVELQMAGGSEIFFSSMEKQ